MGNFAISGLTGVGDVADIGFTSRGMAKHGITYSRGFLAAGAAVGLKEADEPDLALVVNKGPLKNAAALFTANSFAAAPVAWSKTAVSDGRADAIILNSGGANACTGTLGFATTHATAEKTAELLGASPADILVCSTGIIGELLPKDKILAGINVVFPQLKSDRQSGRNAAEAIMTTDTVPKEAAWQSAAGYRIGGMAKGSGMLAPELATMLVVLTTDAVISARDLDQALAQAVRLSFNRLDSDGCMSTNDTVALLASGKSETEPSAQEFLEGLTAVCKSLAWQLIDDAEGSHHTIVIRTINAVSSEDARTVSRAVSRSNLFKAAVFGGDPNWGRILSAVGATSASFEPDGVNVSINNTMVCRGGYANPQVPRELVSMEDRLIRIEINLNAGDREAIILTNDLTHDYVTVNSVYST